MLGSSQGTAYPGDSSRLIGKSSPKAPLSSGNTGGRPPSRERGTTFGGGCQNRAASAVSVDDPTAATAVAPRAGATRARRASTQRAAFAGSEITLEYACSRSARAQARTARRQWIESAGDVPAELPMWTSRDGWINELSAWLATEAGLAECARLHIRAELVLRVAMVLAAHADHATGRNCAVTNATVARGAGRSERSVSTVRRVVAASGLAVLIQQGHGSPTSARTGWRPAIWHLVSRPKPVDNQAGDRAVCDLPPSRRDRRLSLVEDKSPSARRRAAELKSHPSRKSSPRCGRSAPRPLAVQRLADELVGNSYGRVPVLQGMYRGHIGAVCDALMAAGIDPAVWSATQIRNALNADMKARHGSWPDRIRRPGAFLASRLQRLPARPDGAPQGGVNAAGLDDSRAAAAQDTSGETRETAQARTQRWHADVSAVTTPKQRQMVLRAHCVKFEKSGPATDPFAALANAGRRAARLFPDLPLVDGLMRWAGDVLGDQLDSAACQEISAQPSLSADLLMDLAIGTCNCVKCGAPDAPERAQLPLKALSTVCDQCWPVVAAELAQASDLEEW